MVLLKILLIHHVGYLHDLHFDPSIILSRMKATETRKISLSFDSRKRFIFLNELTQSWGFINRARGDNINNLMSV